MKTKIICTIGPATASDSAIKDLIENGMNLARFNFSHDTRSIQGSRIDKVRKWSQILGKKVEILCDLQGPKIRIGQFTGPPKKIIEEDIVTITNSKKVASKKEVPINDPHLYSDLEVGDLILIDDGQIEIEVSKIIKNKIFGKVLRGGIIYPKKGVNLPMTRTTTTALTEKDHKDLKYILKKNPDWVGLSFVQSEDDVIALKKMVGNASVRVMCKIERARAIKNLIRIIDESDGVMIARGDLGVEIPIERLPLIQKMVIKECNETGTPVVTATQMLASMTKSKFPTRAEVSDVANAILDGTDIVMLSNETTVGEYPIDALKMMKKIVSQTEKYLEMVTNHKKFSYQSMLDLFYKEKL